MLIKQKSPSRVHQKLGSQDFWRIADSVLNKSRSDIPPLFNGPESLSSTSNKAKLFANNVVLEWVWMGSIVRTPLFKGGEED